MTISTYGLRRPPCIRSVLATTHHAPIYEIGSSITLGEIFHGIMLLPAGRRRSALEAAASAMFDQDFEGRVLAFGADAARPYARIAADRRRAGRPISHFDAQIAAITRAAGADLATRNVEDFGGCGIRIINPWTA